MPNLETTKKIVEGVTGLCVNVAVGILVKSNAPTTRFATKMAVSVAALVMSEMMSAAAQKHVGDVFDNLVRKYEKRFKKN